jgi:hypothetical protein
MNYTKSLFLSMLCIALSSVGIFAQSITKFEFETSSDLNSWEPLFLRDLQHTSDGKLQHSTDEGNLWYRLKIQRNDQIQISSRVALDDVPEHVVKIAHDFLIDFSGNELGEGSAAGDGEGWGSDSALADYAYPIYNPGILGGNDPALYEFVITAPPKHEFTPGPLTPNRTDAAAFIDIGGHLLIESTEIVKTGSILVSVTDQVEPIPSFATEGDAQVAKLLARAGTPNVKAIWYGVGFLAGEDASGKLIATIGNAPFKIDSTPIFDMIAAGIDEYENIDTLGGSFGPKIQGEKPEFFQSYDEFKNHYMTDPLMVELRERRAKAAILDWDIANGKEPTLVNISIDEEILIEGGQSVTSFELGLDNFEDEQPGYIDVVLPPAGGGAILIGRLLGPVVLTLTYDNGSSSVVLVNVRSGNLRGAAFGSWTSWTSWYAGNWGDQRRYSQYWNDSMMCPTKPSGCGPTAWAILYGWWDRKGAPELLGSMSSADSPLYNGIAVLDCCRYVFPVVGTWCVPLADSAATNPWDMYKGCRWGVSRGVSYSFSTSWGAPYVSTGPRNKAKGAIKDGYPSIIGIGFYSHYPIAYGYRYRKWRWAGVTWSTQRRFKCNMAWGGGSPSWQSASSVWFGQRVRLW